jgi:transcriptional regulator with XRE-family HTH domain
VFILNNITYIQLRAARQVLNIGVREVAKLLKVSKATISNAEQNKTRDFFFKHSAALIDFFEKNNIIFPNEYTIRFDSNKQSTHISEVYIQKNINRFQLKAARCILNYSQQKLALTAKIDKGIISRSELLGNLVTIKTSDKKVEERLKNVFYDNNIEFINPYSIFFKKNIDSTSN